MSLFLFITSSEKLINSTLLEADDVVLRDGQKPLRKLLEPMRAAGVKTHLMSGADKATELDAKRGIN